MPVCIKTIFLKLVENNGPMAINIVKQKYGSYTIIDAHKVN